MNILVAKWKEGGHSIRTDMSWEKKDQATQKSRWFWRVGILAHGVQGEAGDFNKNKAR
jgi:hypothetical protein